ncbi:hypothetical protein [Arthrobacter sp. NicSoilB4]|uniref:hypothetical protein n=1 Tax=Arthrobacter sp. NicSoilB4 TaxID=2830997 RepID=UPI001CC7F34E|nr:hypothetical protein [Arthrobacter sp. NicSoilB4]
MTIMATLLTAAGLFSLLTGVLETARVYSIEAAVDTGLAKLGLAAMIIGGLTTAALGLGVLVGRGRPSLPRTVAVVAGWLIIWIPLTIALEIATDGFLESQIAATAVCVVGILEAAAAVIRPRRNAAGITNAE